MKHAHCDDCKKVSYGKLPPFRFWVHDNLPEIYDESATYLELAKRVSWYVSEIINTLKVYDEKFCMLTGLLKELECYVADYFNSLDLPEMIRDTLDEMAATGRLSEIVLSNIKDFSIDAKKIKNGIVPLHYTYHETRNGNEYYYRKETDEEVVDILRNGSVVLGVFQGSPCNGTFVMLQKVATYIYEGQYEREFKCGCVNTVYTKDFKIYYDDVVIRKDTYGNDNKEADFLLHRLVTDYSDDDEVMLVLEHAYAHLPDGYVTHEKLADDAVWSNNIKDGEVKTPDLDDGAVTHPKLAVDAVWSNNIKDGEVKTVDLDDGAVTHPKLAVDAVWSNNIKDGEVKTVDLADGAVTVPKLYRDVPAYIRSNYPSKYIFIGDSYGAGLGLSDTSQNWINQVATIMGLTKGVSYWSSAVSGAGFTAGTTFQAQFKTLLNSMTQEQRDQITDVVVLGGWNDGSRDVTSGLGEFLNNGNEKLQFANYHLGYISWEDAGITGSNKISRIQGCQNYIEAANNFGIAYIGNIEFVMHDYSLFLSDGIHPNPSGNSAIAGALATYLRGGQVDVVRNFRVDQHVQWDSNVETDTPSNIVSTWLNNNMCGMFTSHTHYKFKTAVTFSGHPSSDSHGQGWTKLFDLGDAPYVQDAGYHGFNDCVSVTLYNGSYWEDYPCWLQLRGNGFYMCPISSNGAPSSNPYKPISGITDAIFQVGSLTLDGWSYYG